LRTNEIDQQGNQRIVGGLVAGSIAYHRGCGFGGRLTGSAAVVASPSG
jgi:hypothetical protein